MIELRSRKVTLERVPASGGRGSTRHEELSKTKRNCAIKVGKEIVAISPLLADLQSERLKKQTAVTDEKTIKRHGRSQCLGKTGGCVSMECSKVSLENSSLRNKTVPGRRTRRQSKSSLQCLLVEAGENASSRCKSRFSAKQLLDSNHVKNTRCSGLVESTVGFQRKTIKRTAKKILNVVKAKGDGKKLCTRRPTAARILNQCPNKATECKSLVVHSCLTGRTGIGRPRRAPAESSLKGSKSSTSLRNVRLRRSSVEKILDDCPGEILGCSELVVAVKRKRFQWQPELQCVTEENAAELNNDTKSSSVDLKFNTDNDFSGCCPLEVGTPTRLENKEIKCLEPDFQQSRSNKGNHRTALSSEHAVPSEAQGSNVLPQLIPLCLKRTNFKRSKRNQVASSKLGLVENHPSDRKFSVYPLPEQTVNAGLRELKECKVSLEVEPTCSEDTTVKRRRKPCFRPEFESCELGNCSRKGSWPTPSPSDEQLNVVLGESTASNVLVATLPVWDNVKRKKRSCGEPSTQGDLENASGEGHFQSSYSERFLKADPMKLKECEGAVVANLTCLKDMIMTRRRGRSSIKPEFEQNTINIQSPKGNPGNTCSSAENVLSVVTSEAKESNMSGAVSRRLTGHNVTKTKIKSHESKAQGGLENSPPKGNYAYFPEQIINGNSLEPKEYEGAVMTQFSCFKNTSFRRKGKQRLQPKFELSEFHNKGRHPNKTSFHAPTPNVVDMFAGTVPTCLKQNIMKRKGAGPQPSMQGVSENGLDGGIVCSVNASSEQCIIDHSSEPKQFEGPSVAQTTFLHGPALKSIRREKPVFEFCCLENMLYEENQKATNSSEQTLAAVPTEPMESVSAGTVTVCLNNKRVQVESCIKDVIENSSEGKMDSVGSFPEPLLTAEPSDPKEHVSVVAQYTSMKGAALTRRGRKPCLQPRSKCCRLKSRSRNENTAISFPAEQSLPSVSSNSLEISVLPAAVNICVDDDAVKQTNSVCFDSNMQVALNSFEVNCVSGHSSTVQLSNADPCEPKGCNESEIQSIYLKDTVTKRKRGRPRLSSSLKVIAVGFTSSEGAHNSLSTSTVQELESNSNELVLALKDNRGKRRRGAPQVDRGLQNIEVGRELRKRNCCTRSLSAKKELCSSISDTLGIKELVSQVPRLQGKYVNQGTVWTQFESALQECQQGNGSCGRKPHTRSSSAGSDLCLSSDVKECKKSLVVLPASLNNKIEKRRGNPGIVKLQEKVLLKNNFYSSRPTSEQTLSSKSLGEDTHLVKEGFTNTSSIVVLDQKPAQDELAGHMKSKVGRPVVDEGKKTATISSGVEEEAMLQQRKPRILHVKVWKRKAAQNEQRKVECKQQDQRKDNKEVPSLPVPYVIKNMGDQENADVRNETESSLNPALNCRRSRRRKARAVEDSSTQVTHLTDLGGTSQKTFGKCTLRRRRGSKKKSHLTSAEANGANIAECTNATFSPCKHENVENKEACIAAVECSNGTNMSVSKCFQNPHISEAKDASFMTLNNCSLQATSKYLSDDINHNICSSNADFVRGAEEYIEQPKQGDFADHSNVNIISNICTAVPLTEKSSRILVENDKGIDSCRSLKQPVYLLKHLKRSSGIKRRKDSKEQTKDAENAICWKAEYREITGKSPKSFKSQKKHTEEKDENSSNIRNGDLTALVEQTDENGLFSDSLPFNPNPRNQSDEQTDPYPIKELCTTATVAGFFEPRSLLKRDEANCMINSECITKDSGDHFSAFATSENEQLNNQRETLNDDQTENAQLSNGSRFDQCLSCQRALPMVGKHVWEPVFCARTCAWPFQERFLAKFKTNMSFTIANENDTSEETIADTSTSLAKEVAVEFSQSVEGDSQQSNEKNKTDPNEESLSSNRSSASNNGLNDDLIVPPVSEFSLSVTSSSNLSADQTDLQNIETVTSKNGPCRSTATSESRVENQSEEKLCEVSTVSTFESVINENFDSILKAKKITNFKIPLRKKCLRKNESNTVTSNQEAANLPENCADSFTESTVKTGRDHEYTFSLNNSSKKQYDFHASLQHNTVTNPCKDKVFITDDPCFPDEDIVLFESSDSKHSNVEKSCKPDTLKEPFFWDLNFPSNKLKTCPLNELEKDRTEEFADYDDDCILLDVIQDDPELFGCSLQEETQSGIRSAKVHEEHFIKDMSKRNQVMVGSVCALSDADEYCMGNDGHSSIQENEEYMKFDMEYGKLFTRGSRTEMQPSRCGSSSVDESTNESLEDGWPGKTDGQNRNRKMAGEVSLGIADDDVKEKNVYSGESHNSAYIYKGWQHLGESDVPRSVQVSCEQEFRPLQPWNNDFGYTGKWSVTSKTLLPTLGDNPEPWKQEQLWQVKRQLPVGYCRYYFGTLRGCMKTVCGFFHVPKKEDEKFCMKIVWDFVEEDTPSMLNRAVQVFTNYYREFPPGVHYDPQVLDELIVSLLKHCMLPDVFHTMNIGANVKALPSAEVFLQVFDHVSSNKLTQAVPSLVDLFCKMVEAGMVLQLGHLDYIEKHVTQLKGSVNEIDVIVSTKSRLQERQFKKNWLCDLDVAVAEIEHCEEKSDWAKLGTLYVNVRMGFEKLPDLRKLSNCFAEALLKGLKEEKIVPFCVFADTVKKDPNHNGIDKNLLGRIGITVMFSYHKNKQWMKGKKVIDKLRELQIHFTVLKGLIGKESEATRCQVVNVAAEILVNSGNLEGAVGVLKESEWVISTTVWPCEAMDVVSRHNLLCIIAQQSLEKSFYQQTFEVLQHLPGLQEATTDAIDVSQYSNLFNKLLESCVDNKSLGLSSTVVDFMISKNIPVKLFFMRALITALGRSSLWFKARGHYKTALSLGWYPPLEGNLYCKTLLIPSYMSEIEMLLALEVFMVTNAGSIQSLGDNPNQSLQIVLKRYKDNQACNKDDYEAARRRLMMAVRLCDPKLFIKHLTVNVADEQVYILEHLTSERWINLNMKWAVKVWLF